MLASWIEDNGVAIAIGAISFVGGAIGWLTKLSSDLASIKSDLGHLRELADLAGNGSRQRDENAAQRIAHCEEQIRNIEINLAAISPMKVA